MTQKYSISSTSALVLLWCNAECYPSKVANRYLEMLNLESGIALHHDCNKIWSHYDEVIINRKVAILELIKKIRHENRECDQMIILGAGLAPLSLECKSQFENIKIFDVDIDNMELKKEMISKINGEQLHDIKFITCDIENVTDLKNSLINNGWNPKKPSILIIEGISYYISTESMINIINLFKSRNHQSRIIIDYLVPRNNISEKRQHIPEKIFELIQKQCNLSEINRYDYRDFESCFNTKALSRFSMKDIEKIRKTKNVHFPTEESGWIEVCLLSI